MKSNILITAVAAVAVQGTPASAQSAITDEFVFENLTSENGEGGGPVTANGSIVVDPEDPLSFIMTGSNADDLEGPPGEPGGTGPEGPVLLVPPPAQPALPTSLSFEITSLSGTPIFNGPASIYFTTASANANIMGTFQYRTNDGEDFDPAGYFINEEKFQLSTFFGGEGGMMPIDGGLEPTFGSLEGVESGMFSFDVTEGQTWGFYIESTDNCCGFSQLAVNTTFDENVVPEPASWAMLIAGFGLVGATMRRRRSLAQTA